MSQDGSDCSASRALEQIRLLYSGQARHPEKDSGQGKGRENARAPGDAGEWLDLLPDIVWESTAAGGFSRAEFHESQMTELPPEDCSADVVISSGAINLAVAKHAVLAELFRVLRPGGRLQIADVVRDTAAVNTTCGSDSESPAVCVSGTLDPGTFQSMLDNSGFVPVAMAGFTACRTASSTSGALFRATEPG